MIKINLLPIKKIKQRLRRRYEVFFLAGSLLLVIMIMAAITLAMGSRVHSLEAQRDQLTQQRSSYLAVQRQIRQLEEKREQLEMRINALESLQVDAELPVRILDEVSNRTPSRRLWLNSLRLSDQTLSIAGIGLDNPTVAQYMRNLEGSPLLADADLISSSQTEVGGHRLQSFTLNISIKPPVTEPAADGQEEEQTE